MAEHLSDSLPADAARFTTTRWSLVVAASGQDSSQGRDALAELCRQYWYPLYVFARRQGNSSHDAQDLTQAFFAFLLSKNSIAVAEPGRGKFRSFLLASFKHFVWNERARAQTQKRGG